MATLGAPCYRREMKFPLLVQLAALAIMGPAAIAAAPDNPRQIGFFSPDGASPEFTPHIQFSIVNIRSPAGLAADFAAADGTKNKLYLDFGPLISNGRPPVSLSRNYLTTDGAEHIKAFAPLTAAKVERIADKGELARRLAPYLPIIAAHQDHLGPIFLLDEPYLNGVSKAELERAAQDVRAIFADAGMTKIRLGVNFAAAMFNSDFAEHIGRAAGDYAAAIDDYSKRHAALRSGPATPEAVAFRGWVDAIERSRLSTYDQAGNMYVGGGIPDGFDVVTFDFYLSTILFDGTHEHTLEWFAQRFPEYCSAFKGTPMHQIRAGLSFFRGDTEATDADRASDRLILDEVFTCRMQATLSLLRAELHGRAVEVMLIGESSSNGLLQFNADGAPTQAQDAAAIEARVLDEVKRTAHLYTPGAFKAGLAYFTYADTYDQSIHLRIGGAADMQSVTDFIYRLAR